MIFTMNDHVWQLTYVDPLSPLLVDRTGNLTLGVTDPLTMSVYISNALEPQMRERVLIHELGHVTMVSYGMLDDIHRMVKQRYWIEAEEWVCNFLADHGEEVRRIADDILRR